MTPEELEAVLWFGGHGEGVEIGDGTIIREQSTVHQGTVGPTRIGASVFIMNKSYVAHDCELGDRTQLGPVGSLAGHVFLGDDANVGMNAAVHQHRRIGAGAMVGMNATVVHDVRPWELVKGTPARPSGLNRVRPRTGRATTPPQISGLEQAYGTAPRLPSAFAAAVAAWRGLRRRLSGAPVEADHVGLEALAEPLEAVALGPGDGGGRQPARSSGSATSRTVDATRPSRSAKVKPSTPSRTISGWPPAAITTGTAPADIASTVVMPKCSARTGSASRSSPSPVACQ